MLRTGMISKYRELFICWIMLSLFLTAIFVNRAGFSFFIGLVTEELFVAKADNPIEIRAGDIFDTRIASVMPAKGFQLDTASPDFAFFSDNLTYFLENSEHIDGEQFYFRLPSSRMLHLDLLIFTIHPGTRKLQSVTGQMNFL